MRLRAVGLVRDRVCDVPTTQNELADATGISTAHVNRALQKLRGKGLITLKAGTLTILDREQLKQAGDFDAAYLHVDREQTVA